MLILLPYCWWGVGVAAHLPAWHSNVNNLNADEFVTSWRSARASVLSTQIPFSIHNMWCFIYSQSSNMWTVAEGGWVDALGSACWAVMVCSILMALGRFGNAGRALEFSGRWHPWDKPTHTKKIQNKKCVCRIHNHLLLFTLTHAKRTYTLPEKGNFWHIFPSWNGWGL